MKEEVLKPFLWGAGKSFVSLTPFSVLANKSIGELTDDELTRLFATVSMPSKLPFLEEMKRRDIKSFVIDLGEDATEEMLMEAMKTFALLDEHIGGTGMSYFSEMSGIIGERTQVIDRGESFGMMIQNGFNQCRKVGTAKPNTFYKTLNAEHNRARRK